MHEKLAIAKAKDMKTIILETAEEWAVSKPVEQRDIINNKK